jgi:type I restriction enzyme, S subunit
VKINLLLENLDVLTENREGIESLRKYVMASAFNGSFKSTLGQRSNQDLINLLISKGSSYKIDEGLSTNELTGIWEGFSLFELPTNWSWMRLDQVGTIVGGGTPDTSNSKYWAGKDGIPWITPADMRNQKEYVDTGKRTLTELGLKESSAKLLPKDTILFSSRAPIGYVGIVGTPLATNQGFKSCVPFYDEMSQYIYFYLMFIGSEINERATGTTFKEVSGKQFASTPIPVPPLEIQKEIVQQIRSLLSLCEEIETRMSIRNELSTKFAQSIVASLS